MNKIIKNIMLLSFLSLGAFNVSTSLKNNVNGFDEIAEDLFINQSKLINLKAANDNSKDVQTSKMFIQNGVTSEGKKCLRFAVALKGNIDSLAFQRGHVEGKEDVDIKSVSAIYKAIEANGKVYYYSPSSNSDDGLTTDETYAGDYYWACYTIRYLSEDFNTSNIPMTLLINGEQTVTRKASLAESIYGSHTHNYTKYLYNDTTHYKTCSLCGTIDETSYEKHSFEITPTFNKTYNVGDAFIKNDLSLSESCICHKELENVNFTYLKTPTTIAFGDSVIVKINGEVKKIVLPTNDRIDMTLKTNNPNLQFGGGNAGVVGKDTDFRFKEEYEIVDGKFKAIEPQGNYPYGNVFINIDINITQNPYIEFPIEIVNEASVRLFLSTSNNYVKQDGVIGSYEQELKKTMDLVIDGETIDYNDITLKALPQSAIDELNKSSKDDLKSHIYFTFYEYELITKKLSSGTHNIRLNFKNGYADTGAASIDSSQPCVGCINYLRYETLTGFDTIAGTTNYIELEDNTIVDYGSGKNVSGGIITPDSKLKIKKTEMGTYKFGSTEYQTYEEAYEVAYAAATNAGKIMVTNARGNDFLASIDGTGASFTINLKDIYSSKKELYLCGASNFVTVMKSWMPYQIDDMNLKDFMTVEVNGKEIELADNLILPGIGDGTSGSHAYWTNWALLNLGVIELDTTLDINTIKFTVSIDKALNEEGKYKYLYNQNENGEGGMYAFGQYDYVMLKDIAY